MNNFELATPICRKKKAYCKNISSSKKQTG
jgi:hypothetical protein